MGGKIERSDKEREGAKEGSRENNNVGSGEGEGELSSVAGGEIVDEIL